MTRVDVIQKNGCIVFVLKGVLSEELLQEAKTQILATEERHWIQRRPMFQPKATAPILRETLWFAHDRSSYFYSNSYNISLPKPHPAVLTIADIVSTLATKELGFSSPIGGYLINRYKDGKQKINHHSDNEPELGSCPIIISVSLGASRTFEFKPIVATNGKRPPIHIQLDHGDVLIMAGPTQQQYTHALPEDPNCHEERINITFRPHYPSLRILAKEKKKKNLPKRRRLE
jgi:alkylated DNA repair dioxygenase AlkB